MNEATIVMGPVPPVRTMKSGEHAIYKLEVGANFDLVLPDGRVLNVELTADDFSIVRGNGLVAYRTPVADWAKANDGWIDGEPPVGSVTTGNN